MGAQGVGVLASSGRSDGNGGVVTGTVHVHPLDDLIEHQMDDSCPCGPRQEPVKREDGSVGWLVVHNSLDGRERDEDAATGTGAA